MIIFLKKTRRYSKTNNKITEEDFRRILFNEQSNKIFQLTRLFRELEDQVHAYHNIVENAGLSPIRAELEKLDLSYQIGVVWDFIHFQHQIIKKLYSKVEGKPLDPKEIDIHPLANEVDKIAEYNADYIRDRFRELAEEQKKKIKKEVQ